MPKKIALVLLSVFCISMYTYSIDGWIRINRLGYLPNEKKKAVLLSESPQNIKEFSIHDALTNEELGVFNTVISKGEFQSYKSTYILDFSAFKIQGAFYIKAGLIYSPTVFINKNIYLGSADFSLSFIRQQRLGTNFAIDLDNQIENNVQSTNVEPDKPTKSKSSRKNTTIISPEPPKLINVSGGWKESADGTQNGSILATAIFQMLFAYQMNPLAFSDKHDDLGKKISNDIPDILDEAKWGLDWLLKMYPNKETIYHEIGDELQSSAVGSLQPNVRQVYVATGKPQGNTAKNHSNGIASVAGKYSSAFSLGAQMLKKFYPVLADTLASKAAEAYQLGKKYPGICQSIPLKSAAYAVEDDWCDDMELAAVELYQGTYDGNYLKDATQFGRMEPVSPWMCSDTTSHYQWYPFINIGHYLLANVENPRFQKEFQENLLNGIQRMSLYAKTNPFEVGVPMVKNSNNLVSALATQCILYRTLTNDSTYVNMENGLIDWLLGRNPWGASMITGLPKTANPPANPFINSSSKNNTPTSGGLISGPVQKSSFKFQLSNFITDSNGSERFQSDWAVYHDNNEDYVTNELSLDGSASLAYLFSGKQLEGVPEKTADNNQYIGGGIIRTDETKKQICLVFSGNEYTDGYKTIRQALKKLNIKASFFFTGDFYRNSKNSKIIKELLEDNHYLGGNSDKNLIYCSMQKHDSLLISKSRFIEDLKNNYSAMEKFGIKKNQTPFLLPPYEAYNDSISQWSKEVGIQIIASTPGTLSNSDTSVPEMRENYFSSNEIYKRIIQLESKQGLNGYILSFHLGADARRQDKFYPQLYNLLLELSKYGYDFVDLYKATDIIDRNSSLLDNKQKKKN